MLHIWTRVPVPIKPIPGYWPPRLCLNEKMWLCFNEKMFLPPNRPRHWPERTNHTPCSSGLHPSSSFAGSTYILTTLEKKKWELGDSISALHRQPTRGTATNPQLVPTRAALGELKTTLRLGRGDGTGKSLQTQWRIWKALDPEIKWKWINFNLICKKLLQFLGQPLL